MARNTSRIVVGGGIAASVVAGATYGLANLMFSYALDAQAKHSMLRSGRDDGKVADKGPRLDAAEEVEAADWFDQSKQPVVISAEDGIQLHGWLFDPDCAGAKPHLYAICCHGYSGQPQDMAKYAHRFARLGFTVLVPALRGHGLSEGRYAGMGWLDRRDLMRWISLIIDSDADARILLQGKSMGAAAVMMTVGEPDLPRNVVAAVEDCGYASVGQQFIDCAGIESPGLTSSPAIGLHVSELMRDLMGLREKAHFIATRRGVLDPKTLSKEDYQQLIREKPAYGQIICRCEQVTEGEILDAIHRPLGAKSLDGVKRRTRAGMGRCQAGFCSPRVMEILARELHVDQSEITKCGGQSRLITGTNKDSIGEVQAK